MTGTYRPIAAGDDGQLPVIKGRNWPLSTHWQINHVHPLAWSQLEGGCGS